MDFQDIIDDICRFSKQRRTPNSMKVLARLAQDGAAELLPLDRNRSYRYAVSAQKPSFFQEWGPLNHHFE
ncbi:MAG: hypothetical protein M2R45_03412 [Verrucomicrobia subdivision 3 bacterium]|nr:hypothetical protein [Limisphaerales bacterium]MCS1416317.1 hypothetical protein [Limisphaerales bacterium]